MKNKLLTISVLALLAIGQSAIATSDNNFTPFDAEAINQVTDNRLYVAPTQGVDQIKASLMTKETSDSYFDQFRSSQDPFSPDFSHE